MYKILIVEDEQKTRDALRENINWGKFGLSEPQTCENGKKALSICENDCPDIVITDIKMPVMDGIEFAEELAKRGLRPWLIFLTAYPHVEYLRKAINYGAIGYVFKPVDLDELEFALYKCVGNLKSYVRKNLSVVQDKFFADVILHGLVPDINRLHEIGLKDKGFYLVVTLIFASENNKLLEEKRGITKDMILNFENSPLATEIYNCINDIGFYKCFVLKRDEICVVLSLDSRDSKLISDRVQRIQENIYKRFSQKVDFRIGIFVESIKLLKESYEMSQKAVRAKFNTTSSGRDRFIVANIKDIIHKNYKNPQLTVNFIADELYYTSSYICMVFKAACGITVNDYINAYKIECSKELLKSPHYKIADIALETGYSNENYFSKVFKKQEGVSPSEFRNSLNKGT